MITQATFERRILKERISVSLARERKQEKEYEMKRNRSFHLI
jgi:hypothetical protein